MKRQPLWGVLCLILSAGLALYAGDLQLGAGGPVPTTLEDFFQPGSQPSGEVLYETFVSSDKCRHCHDVDGSTDLLIYSQWQGSMMAQSARDPLFLAALAIANQDAAFAGDLCIRCHTPGGWISGRSEPTDGSALIANDRDGVSCSVCHRLVDPVFEPGVSPAVNEDILADIDPFPISPGGGNYILDPMDRRRGPYDDITSPGHAWLRTPFVQSSEMCATCHDVSNPVFLRQPDDTYTLTALDKAHPTGDKFDMFPLERTFSEWRHSEFAATGVDMGGRFGGNVTVVSTCQDCHMPDTTGRGANSLEAPVRSDLGSHEFSGGNAWVQDMILNLYPGDNLNPEYLEAGKQRAISMLQRAGTLEVTQIGNHINVRLINETGHKLPTGYPEGRRMWVNVQVFDAGEALIEERGHYDPLTAELTTGDTKVYEINLGIDAVVSAVTGIPEGKSFHFAVTSVILKDNRIPPRGFTNAAYRAVQAQAVGASYADGQYWDDTRFRLPAGADSVTVNVNYQTSSKDYVTFLRDENHTDDTGDVLYEQWELTGKSPPVLMLTETIALDPFADGDANDDGRVDLSDYGLFVDCVTAPGEPKSDPDCDVFDFDADGDVDLPDFGEFQVDFDG
ncbi:MAG: multiheme c-type cytochrome [Phycisphaerae bacterium]